MNVVFLRNDVFELLVDETPDRGKEAKASIDWTDADLLREMVRRRIVFSGAPADRAFEELWRRTFVSPLHGEESSQYVIDRSLMRSRALLDLIGQCRSCAVNLGHRRVEAEDVEKGLSRMEVTRSPTTGPNSLQTLVHLTDTLAAGAPLPSVLEAIRARERCRADLNARLEHLDGLSKVADRLDRGGLTDVLTARVADWAGLVAGQPVQARQLLRKLLTGRVVFRPRRDERGAYYEFSGRASYGTSYGRLLAGVVGAKLMVPKGGLEPPHPCGH